MEYGYYSDEKIPKDEYKDYKTNSVSYTHLRAHET